MIRKHHKLQFFQIGEITNDSDVVVEKVVTPDTYKTFKAPITTAADDKFYLIFPNFQKKKRHDIT